MKFLLLQVILSQSMYIKSIKFHFDMRILHIDEMMNLFLK